MAADPLIGNCLLLVSQKLASSYQELYQAYTRVVEVTQSGRRLLGQYFRVAFFGQVSDSLEFNTHICHFVSSLVTFLSFLLLTT